MIGVTYNMLTVIESMGSDKHYKKIWKCQCACGNLTKSTTGDLRSGAIKSCGCLSRNASRQRAIERNFKNAKHGMSLTKVYKVWNAMIQRCTNPNNKHWKDYGGRGIFVCDEWRNFQNFYNDMGDPRGLTLERINNDFGYMATNCKWATPKEQAQNRRQANGY